MSTPKVPITINESTVEFTDAASTVLVNEIDPSYGLHQNQKPSKETNPILVGLMNKSKLSEESKGDSTIGGISGYT